jgi:hypothetical protein
MTPNYALERTVKGQWLARRARERQHARSSRLQAARPAAQRDR